MNATRELTDGTALTFHREGDDVIAVYDELVAPGTRMVYALVGEHAEAPTHYVAGLRHYAYGDDARLDRQVDRIVRILNARTPA